MIAIYLRDGTRISRTRTLIGGFLPTSWHGLVRAEPRGKFEARVWGLGNLSGKVEMDMFGGLTKTSSRIAIAAALGLTLGGFAFKATPARAADLGGDCCADLEERVAELEATTVRKGNKKVSVTISGWVGSPMVRELAITRYPILQYASTRPAPIPRDAPVMIATLSVLRSVISSFPMRTIRPPARARCQPLNPSSRP